MKLIVIPHRLTDIADGKMRQLQKLRGFCHAVIQQKILRRTPDGIFKYLSEITSVQSAVVCNIFH